MRLCLAIAVIIMTVCAALAPRDPVEFLPTLVPHLVPGSPGVPYEENSDTDRKAENAGDPVTQESSAEASDGPIGLWPAASLLQPATPECEEVVAEPR